MENLAGMTNVQQVQTVSNAPIFWVLCGVTVVLSAIQAILYMRQSFKTAKEVNLDPKIPREALRIGFISAIGPALGVFIVMVGLMASIGGPMAWLRLSIIGAAATELTAANVGAEACGVTLGSEEYTLVCLAVSWFTMALNGMGWLLFTGVATPSLEKLRNKVSGGDMKWLVVLSGACSRDHPDDPFRGRHRLLLGFVEPFQIFFQCCFLLCSDRKILLLPAIFADGWYYAVVLVFFRSQEIPADQWPVFFVQKKGAIAPQMMLHPYCNSSNPSAAFIPPVDQRKTFMRPSLPSRGYMFLF